MSGFVFTPLNGRSADFPSVSAAEQAARDADAERLVRAELDTVDAENPQAQAALEREYAQRFNKPAPAWKFAPIQGDSSRGEQEADGGFRFTPAEPEHPSVLRNLALNNPLSAIAEVGANLASQMVALPAAGLAGLATAAGRAMGVTDKTGADVVHAVGDALTYLPRGEMGKAAAEAVMYPFQKLHEAAEWAGGKTLEAGGSPGAATAVHTAIEGILPLAVAPGIRAGKAGAAKVRERLAAEKPPAAEAGEFRFTPAEEVADAAPAANPARSAAETAAGVPEPIPPHQTAPATKIAARTPVVAAEAAVADMRARAQRALEDFDAQSTNPTPARAQRLAGDDPQVYRAESEGLAILRREGDQGLPGVDGEFQFVPLRDGTGADATALAGAAGRDAGISPRQLRLDDAAEAGEPPRILPEGEYPRPGHDSGGGIPPARPAEAGFRFTPLAERPAAEKPAGGETVPPLDVADAPRRDVAAAGLGEADRPAVESAVASREARHAAGEGADAAALPQPKAARWALVEADDLKASHDTTLRPRPENTFARQGATRAENEAAVQGIVAKLEPERLAEALDDADGAPIVGRDGIVEAGQRRAIAIQRIYQDAPDGLKAHEYRSFIRNNAERFGLAPEQVDGMRSPVLVRLPDEPAPRRAAGYTAPEAGGFANEHATAGRGSSSADRSGLPAGEDLFATIGGGRPAQGWAGATRIRRKDGQPTAVYRGAATELHRDHFAPQALGRATERPSAGLGVWFSTTAGDAAKFGKVSSYHLDIRRPKVFKIENLPGFASIADATKFRDALREQGYDGIAVDARHLGGPLHLVAFDPAQVVRRSQADGRLTTTTPPEAGNAAGSSQRRPVTADFPAKGAVRAQNGEPISQAMASEAQHSWAPGQNYVPLRDAMPATAEVPVAAKSAKPIRREDVLRPFLEALDINVYHGRVKGKRLGYYTRKKETLRVKNKSDLEVTAHEVFHALDDRIPAIRAAWRSDKELREQLRSISYDKKSVAEGYAEAGRLFLTNAAELERVAPKVHGWLETFAETHENGPALRQAQRGMTSWFEQSALDRAKSKIGDPTSLNNRGLLPFLSDKWEAMRKGFRQAVVDDLDGVRLAEMNLTGKLSPLGAYETARLSRAAGSITNGAVRFGHPVKKADGSFTYSGRGLEEILRPVAGKLDDFMTYAVGRSARELMRQGREHLFSPAEIRAAVALETPEFTKAWSEYQTWNRGVLDFAESFGILNPETRKLWKRQEYLPFWRVGQGVSGEGAVSGQWAGVKGLKGGTGNLRAPLENMVQNANALITAALKNDARARVVEMIEAERGGGKFMQKIPAEARPVKIDAKQVQDAVLKDMGVDDRAGLSAEGAKFAALVEKQIAEAPEFYQFFVGGQAPKGKNIVAVMKAGKPEYYEVADPLLLRALQAIDRPAQSWVIKLLGLPKRVGQASIVLDPTFMAANFARDQMMAGIMTKSGFRPIIDAMDGMRHRMTTSPLYREWVANGGGMSSLFLDESAFRAKLEQFYSSQGVDYRTVIDSPKKLLTMIETFGDAFESATRVGSFKRSLEKGEHPRHAAYEARDVSVDFAMSGDLPAIRAAYDLVMFLRPTVVSWDRLYRGVANDPNRGVIAAKTAMLGLASAALYLMNRDDPRYSEMSDFLKDSHFHVFLGDHHFMIPRPFEPGAIGRVAELAVEKVVNDDADGLGKDLLRVIGNTFHLNLMPQIAAPLVEQYANKNSFTKALIESPDHAGLQPFLRVKPGTSETMKAAGMLTRDLPEGFQVNPVRAETLVRGYLNSWATYALLASDRIAFGDRLPEMRADELPVVRRFYSQEPPKHTKFESQFYEMLGEARRLRGTLKELDELGRPELADRKEKSPLAGEAKPLERAQKTLGAIGREMEAVRRDAGLTPREKRQKLDTLTVERNALFKAAVQDSKAAQKAKALTPADMAKRGVTE